MDPAALRRPITDWYALNARPLPWRHPDTTPWGVLVSEVMAQQTPVARVAGPWLVWMERWPTPADLATAPVAEVLRAWGRLGYPRRALRLQQTAAAIVEHHAGVVPEDEEALLALPGVGRYTAAAVMAFAFGRRSLVLDTNVRRVLARVVGGEEFPARSETVAERSRAAALLPDGDADAALWSVAVMELGALVCTARSPRCGECPVADACAWLSAGRPASHRAPTTQAWDGTDRQCRGRIMAVLRGASAPVAVVDIDWPDPEQRERCAVALVLDGLAQQTAGGHLRLPG